MTVLRFALLLVLGTNTLAGCRACGTSYDYAPPVADCACAGCGQGRAGSVISGTSVVEGEMVYEEAQSQEMPMPNDEPAN